MPALPSGTVTLVFTDVEASTRTLRQLGAERYAAALAEHRQLVRDAFAARAGIEIDMQGDAFFCVFARADDAVFAAVSARDSLATHPLRMRVGIHTGSPLVTPAGYVGDDVHLAARIAAAGHGGQILISRSTRQVLDEERVTQALVDLGEHRVKDFPEPVWIYQVGGERFPPLRTISNTNLPRPASSFVGREREVAEVARLIREGRRLVTLAGPGGSGKTRLAVESAAQLVPMFRNGVFWIGLAAVGDPALVLETIGQTLGVRGAIAEHIGERDVLLVLDNFEQVVEAAPEIVRLVEACPNLRLIVTSRELLRVRGETDYQVPPLLTSEAVQLFCERSQLQETDTIAELCRRLEELPLAVELAAARTRVLSPTQILDRLAQRLDLLAGGRDADPRQRSLRAAIEWSYALLSGREQQVFARLSVFAGGWTLDAATEVCEAELDTLQSLVDKSLVRHADERFAMLETIRQFGAERLRERGEAGDTQLRHATWVRGMVIRADSQLHGPDQLRWLDALDVEMGNLRSALSWALDHEPRLGGEIAAHLFWFWQLRSHLGEGERWLADASQRSADWPIELRARLLQGHGQLAYYRGELVGRGVRVAAQEAASKAAHLLSEAAELWRTTASSQELAQTLAYLAIASGEGGDHATARAAGDEAVRMADQTGDDWTLGFALWALGTTIVLGTSGRADCLEAVPILEHSVERLRKTGDAWALAAPLFYLGVCARQAGGIARASELIAEAARLIRFVGDKYRLTIGVRYLSGIAAEMGDDERAARLRQEADALDEELGHLRRTGFAAEWS